MAVFSRIVPDSHYAAQAWNGLGRVQRALGQRDKATESLCRAADALDAQGRRLGGTQESRSAFAAEYGDFHHDCLTARIASGQAPRRSRR